jgi:hypothetical protein
VGNADFARVLASVEQEYAAQAARRVRGDDVLWTGRDGRQVPQDSGAAMGMSPGVPQVSRVRQPVPALGCQVCGETGQVLVPCDHDGTDEQDCARCHEGVVCARCHGVGTVTIMVADARGEQVPTSAPCDHQDAGDEQCDQCHGSGKVCVVCGGTGQRAVPCDACASSGPRARPPQPPGQPATGPLPAPELPPDAVPAEPAFLTARRHAIAGPNTSIWR